jgi:SAM-dependent methyltransferase
MLATLKRISNEQQFQPNLLGVLVHPSYLIRRSLYIAVKANAKHLHGVTLDFGCGRKPYRSLFEVQQYIGLDIEQSGHNHHGEAIDVFYDGKTIPFPDSHFDSVFSSEVFEHVFNPDEVLSEIHRVMKPGATLLLTTPFVCQEHEVPYDFARYTSYGITSLLERKGFRVIRLEKTAGHVEAVLQMWNAYVARHLMPSQRTLRLLLTPLLIAPVTILAIVLSKVLPRGDGFYHNNVVVAEKKRQ